jgi:ABC-type transport system substrate-binding protein
MKKASPILDEVVFEIVPEASAQTAMMLNGEAQVHLWPGEFKAEYDELLERQSPAVSHPWHLEYGD